jgi:GH25 family lysozyme M1 (1,4-beta-N-acetylmuramidase)
MESGLNMDLSQYKIIVDSWEGSGDYDEAVLQANGVAALIIRMNESDGSLQLDEHFLDNWPEASALARAVYVVINPNISALNYYTWIMATKPVECKVMALDIEIAGPSSAAYSTLIVTLANMLIDTGLKVLIYSGAWFFHHVMPWPKQFDQWWARYPYALQPSPSPTITWDQLKAKLEACDWIPFVTGYSEANVGHVVLWQCSSAFYLPGFNGINRTDISVMPNDDFERIWGPVGLTLEERVSSLEMRVAYLEGH